MIVSNFFFFFKSVYRGFLVSQLRATPTNAAALLVWETTMKLLGAERLVE